MTQVQSLRLRWASLAALLAVSAWLAVSGDKGGISADSPDVRIVQPTSRPNDTLALGRPEPRVGPLEPVAAIAPRGPLQDAKQAPGGDLFAVPAWQARPAPRLAPTAAPAASSVEAPPPPQVAVPEPALRVVGKKYEGGKWEVYLMSRDEVTLIARRGEVIESEWRVDQVEPPIMTLTHVPTQRSRTVAIGEAR